MTTASHFPILQQTSAHHKHPHEHFNRAAELEAHLREVVRGEVRFDDASRALYATDASNYRQVPIGLVIPKDSADVVATIAACRKFGAPVLSRGGGTSLAGQCCNVAVVLDLSKYFNSIVTLDSATRLARVQPGLILDDLRSAAEKHKLTFAPDPATHNRCTIGGMIGNNSCGVHALMGGKTVDNILELEVLLYDGTRMRVGPTTELELENIIRAGGRKGAIYQGLKELRDEYSTQVKTQFPDIPRRVSGYNLDQLLPENGFNVARALVGTEGTCVTILEATCELTPSPQFRRLVVLGFENAFVAADHVPHVLKHNPIGLEGFDGLLVEFMHRKNLVVDDLRLLPSGSGFLLCEFGADSENQVEAIVEGFLADISTYNALASVRRYTVAEAEQVWRVREAALGASVCVPGEPSGYEGWEDSAVAPERLGAYLRELFALIDTYGYKSPMYGHFGQGCVHLRITFGLETTEGVAKYRQFLEQAADIVLKYGGSFSGEHGDGQARAFLLPKMFGPELMRAFQKFKALWDPSNGMNPGKLVDPIAVYDATENLRIGPGYQSSKVHTWFQFPNDGGSFSDATTRCVGVGACRKSDSGVMCPSYMATREEQHSTRGRAHLLWELLQGDMLQRNWQNTQVREALDLCLSCKACKTECPVNVDLATWKAEFLAHYYEHRLHPTYHYVFGHMDKLARLASHIPRVANLPLQFSPTSASIKAALNISKQRRLPLFATSSFRSAFRRASARRKQTRSADLVLWPDTWNNYYNPDALWSASEVLAACGFTIQVPKNHFCCGRPLYDFGFLDEARRYLQRILHVFEPQITAGTPFVMLEPSCASVFRDELINLFPNDPRAIRLSQQTVMLSEAITANKSGWEPPSMAGRHMIVHGHCHQVTQMTMKDEVSLLKATGADVTLLDSGCCGMAGPFGFEKDKYQVSQTLAERVLLPAVRRAAPDDILISNGFSCREQISQNSSRHAFHLAEVLAGRCQ